MGEYENCSLLHAVKIRVLIYFMAEVGNLAWGKM
jgi:hypothetical protein